MAQAVIGPDLDNALQNNTGTLEVIVTFHGDDGLNEQELSILTAAGIETGFAFTSLPMAGVLATEAAIQQLAAQPEIRSVYLNKQLEYFNDDGRAQTGVDKVQSDAEFTARNGGLPVSGKGVAVVVNDSGVDGTHPDLEYGEALVQNVLGSTNLHAYSELAPVTYVEDQPNTDTNSGHGTHVAGTVGGRGVASNGLYQGVAPGADLIGYGSGGALFVLDGVGGFDYAITHQFQYGIRIITNSWGSSGGFDPNDPVNVASKIAYDRGILTLFAAGNSGPGENTHNPYSKAPWVISVGAGTKAGELADFSSRGTKGVGGTFEVDGETFTWKDEPTIVAPGVEIVSARTVSPIGMLSTDTDAEELSPGHVPYYTHMQGTSMATPHVAGIAALMLEANPSLGPDEVIAIIRQTATNMYGRESWEVGAGYVNAYASVQTAFNANAAFGSTVNAERDFHSQAYFDKNRSDFEVSYDPTSLTSTDHTFTLSGDESAVSVKIDADGFAGLTGNTLNLILTAPDGTEYSSGISILFSIYFGREVQVTNPMGGEWTVRVDGLRGVTENPTSGVALPETVSGTVTTKTSSGFDGLDDIEGHPAETAIKLAVSERLMDGFNDRRFKPNRKLKRMELADYLMMGQQVRQHLPLNGATSFGDVSGELNTLLAESVTNRGAALRDTSQQYDGVMMADGSSFNPDGKVNRAELAYSLVQGLGMQRLANEADTDPVTVPLYGENIPLEDSGDIPEHLKGHVQVALNLGLLNAYFSLEQGPYDQQPELKASFKPLNHVKRADYAVAVTRSLEANPNAAPAKAAGSNEDIALTEYEFGLEQNYPNPFNPTTKISYSLDKESNVSLTVFNMLGQKVAELVNTRQNKGSYSVTWNAASMSSGVYLYRLKAGNRVVTQKMNLIK